MKRLHFVTLGVQDLARSKAFWAELFGWQPANENAGDIAFFDMGGYVLSLFPRGQLAEDAQACSPEGSGFAGITLAHNVGRKEEVAAVLARAERLGAKIAKPAQDVFWGGHSGYFTDLDGHYWEVAWNPFVTIDGEGRLHLGKN